jgi:formate-dependent nitrite reductase membrane component NrfD
MPDLDPTKLPVRSRHLYALSLLTVLLCLALWIRAKTIGEDERENAERRALFVGLWPSMFWLMGDALRRREQCRGSMGLRRRPPGR